MKRSDISDEIVVLCAAECRRQIERENQKIRAAGVDPYSGEACRAAGFTVREWLYVDELLAELFDAPEKVIFAAIERAADNDLVEYGVHCRGAWPTEDGLQLLSARGVILPPE
jgi:hypothetical protein